MEMRYLNSIKVIVDWGLTMGWLVLFDNRNGNGYPFCGHLPVKLDYSQVVCENKYHSRN